MSTNLNIVGGPNSNGSGNGSSNYSINESMAQSRNRKFLTIDCSDEYILNQYFNNSRIKNY